VGGVLSVQSADLITCRDCAEWAVGRWRGWHPTSRGNASEALPQLPTMNGGECERCGGQRPLALNHLIYQNYHGPYSTGMPDYFYLEICGEPQSRRRFGSFFLELPYSQPNIKYIPLATFIDAKPLSEEWKEAQAQVQRFKQGRALRQQRENGSGDARRASVRVHQMRSVLANNDRSELIAKFKSMTALERATAIITEWPLPLYAYPLLDIPITEGISELKIEDKVALHAKIASMRGEWSGLRKMLESYI
jgi:hypothetical protein